MPCRRTCRAIANWWRSGLLTSEELVDALAPLNENELSYVRLQQPLPETNARRATRGDVEAIGEARADVGDGSFRARKRRGSRHRHRRRRRPGRRPEGRPEDAEGNRRINGAHRIDSTSTSSVPAIARVRETDARTHVLVHATEPHAAGRLERAWRARRAARVTGEDRTYKIRLY